MECGFGLELQRARCPPEAEQPVGPSCAARAAAQAGLPAARTGLCGKSCASSRDAHGEPAPAGRHGQRGLRAPVHPLCMPTVVPC